jgi:hypothetical protein
MVGMISRLMPLGLCIVSLCATSGARAQSVRHYVFYGMDRDRLHQDSMFLASKVFEGAQVAYFWRQLEPQKDEYDFSRIREDLALLSARGKKLFVQFQDVTFNPSNQGVPRYLLEEPEFNGGAAPQYQIRDSEDNAVVDGWAARRWDPAVQQRLHKLLAALGTEFDGRIEGINFAESSVIFGSSGRLHPKGFSFDTYPSALITNMRALKLAFPKSVVLQYANFMPGEWRPTEDKGYLTAVYRAARELGVGVGGPDLLPYRRGQLLTSYPLIRELAGVVPIGIAVQDGNYGDVDTKTGKRMTIAELLDFATRYLQVDYIFWGTEEPYYSKEVVPFLHAGR